MVITDLKDECCSLPKDPLNQSKDKTGHHKVFSPLCAHFPPKRHKNSKQVAANAWFMLLLLAAATSILYRLWRLFPKLTARFWPGPVHCRGLRWSLEGAIWPLCWIQPAPIPAMSNTVALEETNCLIIWKVKILKQFGFTIETAALQLQRDMCVSDQLPLPRPHQLRPPCILSRFSSCVFFHLSVHTTDKKYEMPNTEISSAGQCFNKAACVRPSNSPLLPRISWDPAAA